MIGSLCTMMVPVTSNEIAFTVLGSNADIVVALVDIDRAETAQPSGVYRGTRGMRCRTSARPYDMEGSERSSAIERTLNLQPFRRAAMNVQPWWYGYVGS